MAPHTPTTTIKSSPLALTLYTFVAVLTSTGCFLADWNETHIYNPLWPGHAKFHNAQTMSMGFLLGLLTLYYIYRKPSTSSPFSSSSTTPSTSSLSSSALALALTSRTSDINTSTLLASLYWMTQLSAYLYPEVTGNDQDPSLGGAQAVLSGVLLGVLGWGWWVERGVLLGR